MKLLVDQLLDKIVATMQYLDLANWQKVFRYPIPERVFACLFLLVFTFGINFAQPNAPLFDQANQAYENKKFAEASELYESILATGDFSVELYYNLGNSYYRNSELGKAILNYERALRLQPADSDIQHNLAVAQQQLVDDFSTVDSFFLNRWWNNVANSLSSSAWSIIGLVILWLGIGGLILWQIGKVREQRKRGFFAGGILLLISMIPFSLALTQQANETDSKTAIILEKEITLHSAPDAESTEILQLHEGSKVKLLDDLGEWYKVRLVNGEQGWLPKGGFEKV